MEKLAVQPTVDAEALESLRAAGFTEEGIERVVEARRLYYAGRYSDQTRESSYWSFMRWMVEQGRLKR